MGERLNAKTSGLIGIVISVQIGCGACWADDSSQGTSNTGVSGNLQEIVVTAEKRRERLQDVPMSVTALSGATLSDTNQLKLQDYYSSVPGLSLSPVEGGGGLISIRGITTGGATSNSTVSVVIDDIPFGTTIGLAGAPLFPDLDPSDLQRIEVLRGPQGALYGASGMGGLIKFITLDPSFDGFSGHVQIDGNAIYNGDGAGYGVRGAVNLPVTSDFAVRLSGFARQDPGYIDNIQTGQDGVNWDNAAGGLLSALWAPSDSFSLKLGALVQDMNVHGYPQVYLGAGFGDLQQSVLLGSGWQHQSVQAYSIELKGKLGFADLTFLSGYNVNTASSSFDYTPTLGAVTKTGVPGTGFDGYGVSGTPLITDTSTRKNTEELRVNMPLSRLVDWTLGGFYTHESTGALQQVFAENESTGQFIAQTWNLYYPQTYQEYAAFSNLTLRLTDRFDVQMGARESKIHQSYEETDTGIYAELFEGSNPAITPYTTSSASTFTWLLTPRFRISPDLMVYSRLATGYRPGGPNSAYQVVQAESQYAPDKTTNYELGAKGNAFGENLSYDLSIYYIDWKDIQLSLVDPTSGFGYLANAGGAKSEGVELSLKSQPLSGLALGIWIVWNEAELTESFPKTSNAYGAPGNSLPYTSRFSGQFSADQSISLDNGKSVFFGVAVAYLGKRWGEFTVPNGPVAPSRQTYSPYAKTDFHVGAKVGPWVTRVFANNVTDKRGVLSGGLGQTNPQGFSIIQPRTIGLAISITF